MGSLSFLLIVLSGLSALQQSTSAPAPTPAGSARVDEKPVVLPTITNRVRDLQRKDGFLPFYWDGPRGELLLEISAGMGEFLYGSGLAGGAGTVDMILDRGDLGALGICRFERIGPKVILRQEQTVNRSGDADPEKRRVVEESFPSSILAALPIVAEEADRVLVDATSFVIADTPVAGVLKMAKLGEWKQDLSRSALSLDRTGAFPRNTEIEAEVTEVSENAPPSIAAVLPDGRTMTLRIHHTFMKLPEPGYEPRALDPRVGFIPERYLDHTAPYSQPIEKYFATRWRLVKKDPGAKLSEPVEPLIYYLDRGIPEPERSAIRAGALWWNGAFELAGFQNAIVIKDLPAGATFLDARYTGVEWVNRIERSWSFGAAQTDPRTGEILHGVARIDSHRRRTTARMWQNLRSPASALMCLAGSAPDFSWLAAGDPDLHEDEESLVLQRLAYLAAHEVGHTLGLMHNWAATTFGWGSVMDYLAPNIQLRDGRLDLSDAYPKDIGSYDRLVIEWGYSTGKSAAELDHVVRGGLSRGIFYPLESDPRWAEYDWGSDPVHWLATTQAVRAVILDRFGMEQLKPGDWVYDLQQRFDFAYLYHRFGIQTAQQFIGGQFQTNALAGDGQKPVSPVPAAQQKQALALLLTALEPKNLDIPDRILKALVPAPSGTSRSQEQFASEGGEVFSLFSAARVLSDLIVIPLLLPERAARLTLPGNADALTLDQLIADLVAATWGAAPDATIRLASLRRVTQRVVLDAMLDLAARRETSPEARTIMLARLERLRGFLKTRHSADPAQEAHLRAAERDLAEFFDEPRMRAPRPPRLSPPPGRPIGEAASQP